MAHGFVICSSHVYIQQLYYNTCWANSQSIGNIGIENIQYRDIFAISLLNILQKVFNLLDMLDLWAILSKSK